jgi:hypothetical protein
MYPTHVYSINGDGWTTLEPFDGPIESELGRLIGLLDGSDLYSLILWRLPPGKGLFDTKPSEEANDYMQCAGCSEQLVVELRTTADGEPRQPPKMKRPPGGATVSGGWNYFGGGGDTSFGTRAIPLIPQAGDSPRSEDSPILDGRGKPRPY